ncbi:hypothetical protein CEXT_229041 [Caerostris extrusa]|uniref:Uncharacterized protein n=1 Tax=Caerostris extrusa TaxID=172846 RepID=A0AAV4VBB2_CAEEX|nr:hypothetical protein CEXT_229041 [Caerostris extrusa]
MADFPAGHQRQGHRKHGHVLSGQQELLGRLLLASGEVEVQADAGRNQEQGSDHHIVRGTQTRSLPCESKSFHRRLVHTRDQFCSQAEIKTKMGFCLY